MATQSQINTPDVPVNPESVLTPKERWLAGRRSFIGGSEIFQLLNERQYAKGCNRALGYEKLNTEPDYPQQVDPDQQDLFERGTDLEELVAAKYERETGRKVRRAPMSDDGFPKARLHPDYPFLGVHVDRIILAGSGDVTETGSLEIKTHREGPFLRILGQGLFPGHILQIQHAMLVNRHAWGAFAVLWPDGWKLKHFDVRPDPELHKIIVAEGEKFANTVWGKGELPAQPFPSDDQRCKVCPFRMTCRGEELDLAEAAAVKAMKAGKKVLVQIQDPQLARALFDREMLDAEIAEREEAKELVDTHIKGIIGDADAVYVPGYGKLYQMAAQYSGLDVTRMKQEDKATYDKFFISGRPTGKKCLRVYPQKQ